MNQIQYFDIEIMINEKRNIKGFELENKIKVVLISDPQINISSCSIAVGAGYLQDEFPGTAHFLEHLLFMGSEKYPEQNDYHSYIQINGGYDNAFTADNMTCYYIGLETSFLKKGIEMLSWFFRAPLLDESHIKSEMEIIDSEHNKNILQDNWIIDDIFKNFIKTNSKFKKFGTGNMKSLESIKKKDIIEFYNKYYTTDNLYICIVDSKDIDTMFQDYIQYFQEIPPKFYESNTPRFIKNKLELIPNDTINFNFPTEYIFLNYYIILNACERNIIEYQLTLFINYLIGCEYENSLGFYLKENDIVKNFSCSIEYFYDSEANINLQLIMLNNDLENLFKSQNYFLKYLNDMKNITEDEFKEIYNNYRKIKTLHLLYNSNSDAVSVSNNVVENMLKGNLNLCLIRQNYVLEYTQFIYQKYLELLNTLKIKITTNINYESLELDKFKKSEWYESVYLINDDLSDKIKNTENISNIKFNISNIIGLKNFMVKNYISNVHIDKFILPELIYSNDYLKKQIYLVENNKYDKPIANISVIRKNLLLKDKYNKIIFAIYVSLCDRVLNYYLDLMSDYKLSFSISLSNEFMIYNFYGLDYNLNYFISHIMRFISVEILFSNSKINKYFDNIIRDLKESIINFKYNSPYFICMKYLSYILNDNLLPDEKLEFISNLKFEDFKNKILECLKYTEEYYIIIGLKKYGSELLNIEKNHNYNFETDGYLSDAIDIISLNHKIFLISQQDISSTTTIKQKNLFCDYEINNSSINPNEINNTILRYWKIGNLNIPNSNDKYPLEFSKKMIKLRLIANITSEILGEPLFDKIRTIDKLGYIVRSESKIVLTDTNIYFLILFLVQSSHSIKRIDNSMKNFNSYLESELKNNYENYLEKFRLLKESKLIELKKPFADLTEELSSYIETIVSKVFIFDLNKLVYEICNDIDFEKDIEPVINYIISEKTNYYNIILDSKNKK